LRESKDTAGDGEFSVGFASAGVKREHQTERDFSVFWPRYLEELLASRKMRKAVKILPLPLKDLPQGSWCKCVCSFRVVEVDKTTNQVKVTGEVSGEGHPTTQIRLSCSYDHFGTDKADGEVSSYAMPFVHDRMPLELESVFLVLTAGVIDNTNCIVGSPIYMALPERKLPWQK